ncbi:hypothetical protein [Microlunatus antarcticus]|uniref:Uncharacterized protein n=1 Tax=Microlunatus antarcticus TaxID=53388 RepID=A0A7W5P5I6_9ACTN|nr:hypothetical protein [Microlunatus antarcticus]MBB3325504.1 hypothetical protein [Microlunatus antarcticus]
MLIWSRWGILLLPVVGLGISIGVIVGAITDAVTGASVGGSLFLGVGLVLGGVFVWLFDRYALPHLDRPRQQLVLQPLAQPYVHPNGVRQTHQQVPLVDQRTGQPVWVRPTSSLFFVPVRYWPYVVAGIGLVVTISSAVRLLVG